MKTIYLKNYCGIEILSRANIRKLYDIITDEEVIVDFIDVTFISRSVADELCNIMDKYPLLHISNMIDDVATMLNIVQKSHNTLRKVNYRPRISMTYNCKTMDDVRTALLSFGS